MDVGSAPRDERSNSRTYRQVTLFAYIIKHYAWFPILYALFPLLKERQPKGLILWGRNDSLFTPAAPEFTKQVLPTAELRYFDGGHFVLDENAEAIAEAIIETFSQ